ncbi:hypothetical protein E2320_012444 [Naja naja]|nr:hypothetical protein E2320_012444 [Naja naja]
MEPMGHRWPPTPPFGAQAEAAKGPSNWWPYRRCHQEGLSRRALARRLLEASWLRRAGGPALVTRHRSSAGARRSNSSGSRGTTRLPRPSAGLNYRSKGPSNTADGLLSQAGLGAPLVLAWQKRDRLGKETLDTLFSGG